MAWRDEMRPGSFRGVPFLADRHSESGLGRRGETVRYPLRDLPYAEDLGREAGRWHLDLYLVGPDYMADRDRLRAALRAEGPGELVHPWLGTLQVIPRWGSLRESTRSGGMCRFSVQFDEAGTQPLPDTSTDYADTMAAAANSAQEVAATDFSTAFSTDSTPSVVQDAAMEDVTEAAGAIDQAVAGARKAEAVVNRVRVAGQTAVTRIIAPIAAYQGLISTVYTTVRSLAAAPASLVNAVVGLASAASDLVGSPAAIFTMWRGLFHFGNDKFSDGSTSTSNRATMARNSAAVSALVRRLALTQAATAVANWAFESAVQARDIRDELAEALDAEAETASDEVYRALTTLRATVVRGVALTAAALPELASYTPPATVPALVIAHRVHGDASRADEIVTRNRVRHPGAVRGGEALEVLTRA